MMEQIRIITKDCNCLLNLPSEKVQELMDLAMQLASRVERGKERDANGANEAVHLRAGK